MKQTGQFKIIKNGSSVNFEHQVTFIFTKQDKTNFTRSTNAKGAWDFDVPNGEYFISAFLTQSEEKKTEHFRGGLLFVVNAQTKVTALDDWVNGGAIDGKDPMKDWWENLLNETQQAAQDAEAARDEIKNNSVGSGKYMKEGAGGWLGNSIYMYTSDSVDSINEAVRTSVIRGNGTSQTSNVQKWGGGIQVVFGSDATNNKVVYRFQMTEHGVECLFKSINHKTIHKLYSNINTTVDSNGFIKKASPIIKLFNDHIEHNDRFKEEPIFEKIDVGTYKISNTHGLAREGWTYEKPRGSDGNPYFRIVVEKLDDGCVITVHDEYESFEKAEIIDADGNKRVINKVVKILGQKRDIQEHERWIDLRFHEQIYSLTNELPEINVPYRESWGIEPYIPPIVELIEEDIALKDQRAF